MSRGEMIIYGSRFVRERLIAPAWTRVSRLRPIDFGLPEPLDAVWYGVGVIEMLLGLRTICSLIGATETPFVWFLYSITGLIANPFRDIFNAVPPLRGANFDVAAVAAMASLLIFAWVVTAVFLRRTEASRTFEGIQGIPYAMDFAKFTDYPGIRKNLDILVPAGEDSPLKFS